MSMKDFRKFVESIEVTITGGENHEIIGDPIAIFDVNIMMDVLSKRSLLGEPPIAEYTNKIQWGQIDGSLRIVLDSGMSVFIEQLIHDKLGDESWITKKSFQINRGGKGGSEVIVADELFFILQKMAKEPIQFPKEKFDDTQKLTLHIGKKLLKVAKPDFIFKQISQIKDDAYLIEYDLRGGGSGGEPNLEALNSNHTFVIYEKDRGIIRIMNQSVVNSVCSNKSPRYRTKEFDQLYSDGQSFDEISEGICIHFKYY